MVRFGPYARLPYPERPAVQEAPQEAARAPGETPTELGAEKTPPPRNEIGLAAIKHILRQYPPAGRR